MADGFEEVNRKFIRSTQVLAIYDQNNQYLKEKLKLLEYKLEKLNKSASSSHIRDIKKEYESRKQDHDLLLCKISDYENILNYFNRVPTDNCDPVTYCTFLQLDIQKASKVLTEASTENDKLRIAYEKLKKTTVPLDQALRENSSTLTGILDKLKELKIKNLHLSNRAKHYGHISEVGVQINKFHFSITDIDKERDENLIGEITPCLKTSQSVMETPAGLTGLTFEDISLPSAKGHLKQFCVFLGSFMFFVLFFIVLKGGKDSL